MLQISMFAFLIQPRLSPKCFGVPNNRDRTYRVLFNGQTQRWTETRSLQALAELILVPKNTCLRLDCGVWAVAGAEDIRRIHGTACVGKEHLSPPLG